MARQLLHSREFWAAAVAGVVGGLLTGMFGIGGPPLMILFSFLDLTPTQLRGTALATFTLATPMEYACVGLFGVFKSEDIGYYLISIPAGLFGSWCGAKLSPRVNVSIALLMLMSFIIISVFTLVGAGDGTTFGTAMLVFLTLTCTLLFFLHVWLYVDVVLPAQHRRTMAQIQRELEPEGELEGDDGSEGVASLEEE